VITGLFRSPSTGQVVKLFESNGQQFAAFNGHQMPMEMESDGALRTSGGYRLWNYAVELVGARERPDSIRCSDFGNSDELIPVQERAKEGSKAASRSITGRYRSDTISTELTIEETTQGLRMKAAGRFGSATHKLEYLADGLWDSEAEDVLALPPWGMVALDEDGKGLRFSNVLNRNLRFRRVE